MAHCWRFDSPAGDVRARGEASPLPVRLFIALIPMLIISATTAGENFRFQGNVDVVPARSPVASTREIREACTLENRQIDSDSPQITGTREADPAVEQSEAGSSPRCVVTIVYD